MGVEIFVLNQIKMSNSNLIDTSINIINTKFKKNTLNISQEKLDIPIFIAIMMVKKDKNKKKLYVKMKKCIKC